MKKDIYLQRRQKLVEDVKKEFGEKGVVLLFANFEQEGSKFWQESNFYYLSGIVEPGIAMLIDLESNTEIYIHDTNGVRAKWVDSALSLKDAQKLNVSEVKYFGDAIVGYEAKLFLEQQNYSNLLEKLSEVVRAGGKIFTVYENMLEQKFVWSQLCSFDSELSKSLIDVSSLISALRRKKSNTEVDYLCKAIEITATAQEAAAKSIVPQGLECEVQAAIEYVFTSSGADIAFPSIVGSGKNSTVLHYGKNSAQMQKDDLVVVDIGARYEYYCADITRTYPVGGKFSERQREIYETVLETQEYVAECAQPGMWINNPEQPEKSLTHLAREFMKEKGGYDKYFIHGIGHFLGIDVHDVGDYKVSLKEGDVITIEPGIYIVDEKLGVRIEDNYLVTSKGAVCLSDMIPKTVEAVEQIVGDKW